MNPHALRHWILSPARLPFRHSRGKVKGIGKFELFEGEIAMAQSSVRVVYDRDKGIGDIPPNLQRAYGLGLEIEPACPIIYSHRDTF